MKNNFSIHHIQNTLKRSESIDGSNVQIHQANLTPPENFSAGALENSSYIQLKIIS